MPTPVRRSLVLATLLALLIGVIGVSAPVALAAQPTVDARRRHQRRRDDDPPAPAADESPPADVGPARPVLPPPDHAAEPEAPRGDHGQPDGPRPGPRRRQGAALSATAARCSGSRCSSRTTSTRPACRRPRARGPSPARMPSDAFIVQQAQGGRRDHHRQGQPVRVGELPVRTPRRAAGPGSAARRTCPTSSIATRAAPAPAPASRHRRGPRHRRHRHRDRRLDRLPGRRQRHRRAQADDRAVEPRRRHPDLGRPGHRRPDDPQRHRRGRRPRRGDRHRSRTTRRRPPRPATPSPTTPSSSTRTRSRASASAIWRAGTYSDATKDIAEPILADVDRRPEGPGRDGGRPDRHRPHGSVQQRVPGAPLRVQDRHRDVPPDVHRGRLPEDARGPDRLQHGPSRSRRALELRPVGRRRGDGRPGVGRLPGRPRGHDGARRRPPSTASWPRTTWTRSSASTNGPAWVTSDDPTRGDLEGTDDFSLFMGNSTASAVAGYADDHRSGGVRRATCRSASRSSAAAGRSRS